jgi:EAL domain-containing protein (putative c-di-GMP-specific phosphodiesterase class I)
VPPARFIPVAEDSNLILPIGEWVLAEACRQNRAWQAAGLPAVPVAVNLSAVQFRQKNLADIVGRALADSGLEPRYLELELTEGVLIQDTPCTLEIVDRLKAMGVLLSIDDFGTGYSSLSYLKRFDIDKLKIDQSFVRDLPGDLDDAAIAQAVIGMAHGLRLQVIAEGVETAEQLEFLRRNGCDQVQGYYFSKAVPAQEMEVMLAESGTRGSVPLLR